MAPFWALRRPTAQWSGPCWLPPTGPSGPGSPPPGTRCGRFCLHQLSGLFQGVHSLFHRGVEGLSQLAPLGRVGVDHLAHRGVLPGRVVADPHLVQNAELVLFVLAQVVAADGNGQLPGGFIVGYRGSGPFQRIDLIRGPSSMPIVTQSVLNSVFSGRVSVMTMSASSSAAVCTTS